MRNVVKLAMLDDFWFEQAIAGDRMELMTSVSDLA